MKGDSLKREGRIFTLPGNRGRKVLCIISSLVLG